MTVIDTSTAATATAYSNQRKVDRCQNGVLWAMFNPSAAGVNTSLINELHYSTDNGATWTLPAGTFRNGTEVAGTTYTTNASMFIDLDDYCHVVFKDNRDGRIYYRRGTPNAGRTAWTWSTALEVVGGTVGDYPDIVAHREGTGWVAHIIVSSPNNNAINDYYRVVITSGGSISLPILQQVTSNSNANSTHKFPSIDFNHTGDGKTVAGSTPHLYITWSKSATGSGNGIRFRKATYSGGTWTWGSEREIDSTRYVINTYRSLQCMFDGTRVIIAGFLYSGSVDRLMLYDRDAADTTTTVQLDETFPLFAASFTYDGEGNIYFFGVDLTAPHEFHYKVWTRATDILGSAVVVDADVGTFDRWVSAKRGYSNGKIEFIYTDGASSPYNVVYGNISLNAAPNVPTAVTRTGLNTDTTPNFSASVTDPDSGDQIKARFEIQTLAGAAVGSVDSDFRTGDGAVTAEYNSALAVGQYRVRAKTIDTAGEESANTDWVAFNITQQVSPIDSVFFWNVGVAVTKDTQLIWDAAIGNMKDVAFVWNVSANVDPIELEMLWTTRPVWTEVVEATDTWRLVP